MKKIFLILAMISLTAIGFSQGHTYSIKSGGFSISWPPVFTAADSIVTSDSLVIAVTNVQKYMQIQTVTATIDDIDGGSPSILVTARGKVSATDNWHPFGTPVTWTAESGNPVVITATTPINYNYIKVSFVASGATQHSKLLTFDVKTANAYDIPANSGTLTVSRATTGAVIITTKDDDANAATTYRAGGSGALTLGNAAGTTAIASSDWAISATGAMTGIGAITTDGLLTAGAAATVGTTLGVTGVSTFTGGFTYTNVSPVIWAKGGATVLATSGTDVACSNGARWWVEVDIPYNVTLTGLAYLVGSVGGTDSVVVQLHNSAGVQVASSRTVTGPAAIVGTAAQFQSVPFTASYAAVAGKYYASVQFNGTTAKFRAYPIPGSKFITGTTGGTWRTKADITPGTTFTADKGPIVMTY